MSLLEKCGSERLWPGIVMTSHKLQVASP